MGKLRLSAASRLGGLTGIILAGLFAVAAVDQIIHFGGFVTAVKSYHLLPAGAERYAAIFVVMAELATAAGLLLGRWRRPACVASVLLLSAVTAVYLVAAPEGICGSRFTLTLSAGGPVPILQNLAFIGLAVLTWLESPSRPDGTDAPAPSYLRHSTAT